MPRVRCNGLELYYADVGRGEPVVFLNGLAGEGAELAVPVQVVAGRFRCLALDNRDAGQVGDGVGCP